MLVCLKCCTLFDEEPLKPRAGYKDSKACPVKDCGGTISDIDEAIIPVLLNLNKKGYETEFSCAGHFYEECPNTYIKFANDYSKYMKCLPEGFVIENLEGHSTIIRKCYEKSSEKDRIDIADALLYSLRALTKWSKKLPSIYEDQKNTLVILQSSEDNRINFDLIEKFNDDYSMTTIAFDDQCSVDYVLNKISNSLKYDIICVICNKLIIDDLYDIINSSANAKCTKSNDINEIIKLL